MNLTEDEIQMLEACQSSKDWDKACDKIKETRNGQYPEDWWPRVKLSGMMDRILARWGSDSEIHLEIINPDGSIDRVV